jgi:hypothetical protein
VDFLTACNTVARQVDVQDTIAAAQLLALSSPEVRRIADEVNRAYLYFYSNLSAEERPQVFDKLTVTTNQVTFSVSDDLDIDNITDVIESTTRKPLVSREYLDLYKELNGPLSQTGNPDIYYILSGRLGFAPMQDAGYTYLIAGGRKAIRLKAATDDLLIPEQYVNCVTDHAVGYLKKYHNDPDADNYIKRAMETFGQMQSVATAIAPQKRALTRIG